MSEPPHAPVQPNQTVGPAVHALSPIGLGPRLHARMCYARPAPAPLLARRARICGRRVLFRPPSRPARRDVLEAVRTAAVRRQLHVLVQQRPPAAAAFIVVAAARLAGQRNRRRPSGAGRRPLALPLALRLLVAGVLVSIESARARALPSFFFRCRLAGCNSPGGVRSRLKVAVRERARGVLVSFVSVTTSYRPTSAMASQKSGKSVC